ncbi:MAG: aconitase X catalytic domain-containing protein [Dehalobacterium sp.]
MVKLTAYEQKMLNGEMGEFKQKALEFIVKYANVLGAEELCEVTRATLFIGAQHYLDVFETDDYEEIFSKFYLSSDKKIKFGNFSENCVCQTCAAACDLTDYETTHLSKEFFDKDRRFLEITKKAGVNIVNSCTPYYVGWLPLMGEHFVTTESSNTLMSNSFFGAYGNSDGIEAAVCSAICGRTPLWGNHIKENRYGTVVFNIQCKSDTVYDWDIIGYTVGRYLPFSEKPIISGDFKRPNINKLRQLFSALATTSAAEICHIVGITPEAHTLEMALGGKPPIKTINITDLEYKESEKMICDPGSGEVDYVNIGCPHLALDELRDVALYMEGKKVKDHVEFLIWTDYATKAMSDVNGYTKIIEDAGAHVLTGSCPVVMKEASHKHAKAMVMNGAKQAHAIKAQTKAKVYFGDIYQCIDAAISGRWEGYYGEDNN